VALLFNTNVPATAQHFLLAAVRSIVKQCIGERELRWRAV
jgi:hypothetical protein